MRNHIYVWVGVFVFVILLSGSVQALVLNYRQPSQIWRKYELFSVMKGSMRNIDTILEIWKVILRYIPEYVYRLFPNYRHYTSYGGDNL